LPAQLFGFTPGLLDPLAFSLGGFFSQPHGFLFSDPLGFFARLALGFELSAQIGLDASLFLRLLACALECFALPLGGRLPFALGYVGPRLRFRLCLRTHLGRRPQGSFLRRLYLRIGFGANPRLGFRARPGFRFLPLAKVEQLLFLGPGFSAGTRLLRQVLPRRRRGRRTFGGGSREIQLFVRILLGGGAAGFGGAAGAGRETAGAG
jgi:hypothetical protein